MVVGPFFHFHSVPHREQSWCVRDFLSLVGPAVIPFLLTFRTATGEPEFFRPAFELFATPVCSDTRERVTNSGVLWNSTLRDESNPMR